MALHVVTFVLAGMLFLWELLRKPLFLLHVDIFWGQGK